jgi:hypothetical protein
MGCVVSWCWAVAVDVVGGELWHCRRCELHEEAYLVIGEGVCLRHDGGGVWRVLGLDGGIWGWCSGRRSALVVGR